MIYCNTPNLGLNPSLSLITSYVSIPVDVGRIIYRARNYPNTRTLKLRDMELRERNQRHENAGVETALHFCAADSMSRNFYHCIFDCATDSCLAVSVAPPHPEHESVNTQTAQHYFFQNFDSFADLGL